MSVDVLCAMHDCALGFSPVTSYSGVKKIKGLENMDRGDGTCVLQRGATVRQVFTSRW